MATKHLAAAGALALVAIALFAGLALAHSRPVRFDPPPGAVLATPPAKVDGWFGVEVRRDPNWTFLRVTDAQSQRVDQGETRLSTDRRMMSVDLRPNLPPGRYLVTWRSWDDADGEIFGDCYWFFIGQTAADEAVTQKLRLDGGSQCQRTEVGTKNGTPSPNFTPTVSGSDTLGEEDHAQDSAGDGLPAWTIVLGVVAGIVVGGVGGRYVGSKP